MKSIYKIEGMHCRSCEVLIEDEIRKIGGVTKVVASTSQKSLTVYSDENLNAQIKQAVRRAGYQVVGNHKEDGDGSEKVSKGGRFKELALAFLGVIVLLWLFRTLDISTLLSPASFASSNLAAIFTIGLTAGVSSCMALVGGLILGISARHAEKHPNATTMQKFRPHLFFNLGRLVSFFVLGGLLGEVGSVFKLSGGLLGWMIIIVGIVMLFLGIQLTEIFPKLTILTLPKVFSRFTGKKDNEYSHKNSLLLGALTFFLPCGFTQAAQIYAVSTGSFVRGGLIMLFFALGTAPGLLGIGGLTSAIKKGAFSRIFFKAVGILIILLSLYNLQNGLNLLNIKLPKFTIGSSVPKEPISIKKVGPVNKGASDSNESTKATILDGVQVIKAEYQPEYSGSQYVITPRNFTVKANQPVRFEVLAKSDGVGCMGSVTLPGLTNDFKIFTKDQTATFEFTPALAGTFQVTCAMGIPMGTITVTS